MPMIWKRLTNITNAVTLHPVSYVVQNTVSLHTSQVAYQASACLRYLYHEATRNVFTPAPLPTPPPSPMGCWSTAGLPPSMKFAGIHLYTWVERGTVRVSFREHNTMSSARSQAQTTRSEGERSNHEITAPLYA